MSHAHAYESMQEGDYLRLKETVDDHPVYWFEQELSPEDLLNISCDSAHFILAEGAAPRPPTGRASGGVPFASATLFRTPI